ncbi:uncharacterized protein LOC134187101 [Corticium candelabrum]|uniref:uncharacterized protein LOC134187101 n=1 Tax=Corticium candelabrum TaxID=121492 RepID=UPI002E252BB7|nr:uncharacterized protein LOC134187101 [Corticium candelabrum]
MVRHYQPKGIKNKFSDEALRKALQDLAENQDSIRKTAAVYGIPYSTLRDHHKGVSKTQYGGRPTVLTYQEEREIVQCCIVLQEMGFPLDRSSLSNVISDYLRANARENPFPDDLPGPDWFVGFFKRRKSALSQRKPQHLSKKRAKALTKERIEGWMKFVEKIYRKAGLFKLSKKELSKRIWNCDETAFATASSSRMVLARRGAKSVYETMAGSGREYITVHWGGNTNGDKIPPYILYKAQHLYHTWTLSGPTEAMYGVSASGWMEKQNFYSWFVKGFIPVLKKMKLIAENEEPSTTLTTTEPSLVSDSSDDSDFTDDTSPSVILFFDGHYSHINLDVINVARKYNIILVTLPPNTTHALQPLDVGVFAPMKKNWQKILIDYKRRTRGQGVRKTIFPKLLKQLTDTSMKPHQFQGAFRGAGLYPKPSAAAIPQAKISPADAVTTRTPCKSPRSPTAATTPAIKLQLRHHFSKLFQKTRTPIPPPQPKPSARVDLAYYGEVITSHEAYSRIKAQDERKQQRLAKAKKGKQPARQGKRKTAVTEERDENKCQGCGGLFDNDSNERQEDWVGCEHCWRWYHYDCAGLSELPEDEDPWTCSKCS